MSLERIKLTGQLFGVRRLARCCSHELAGEALCLRLHGTAAPTCVARIAAAVGSLTCLPGSSRLFSPSRLRSFRGRAVTVGASTGRRVGRIGDGMATLVRALVIVLIAAFTAGTVAHAANATTMDVTMAIESMDMDMPDCQGCPDDGDGLPSCDTVCITPFVAVMPVAAADMPVVGSPLATPAVRRLVGRTGPLDPYPPRSTILS